MFCGILSVPHNTLMDLNMLWTSTYTKYDIQQHTVLYVTMVTFQMTFLMNKWTNIVMDDGCVHIGYIQKVI